MLDIYAMKHQLEGIMANDQHHDDDSDPLAGMGAVVWTLLACAVAALILFLSIPW
jgi:hypothetical protein